jgi:cell division transport system permease protein
LSSVEDVALAEGMGTGEIPPRRSAREESRWKFFFSEAGRSLRANFSTTAAAVVTVLIVLYLFGLGVALGSYVYNETQRIAGDLTVKVFLASDATKSEKADLRARLAADTRIQPGSITFIDSSHAFAIARKKLGDNVNLVDRNAFPEEFDVKARSSAQTPDIAKSLKGLPGLAKSDPADDLPNPDYGGAKADKLLKTVGVIEALIVGVTLILGIAAVLLIGNTIRLSIFARRREVEVMKLVGATNWFVRWPFILEGVICGFLGGILSIGLLLGSVKLVVDQTTLGTGSAGAHAWPTWFIGALMLAAGVGLGAIGSAVTIRRFLKI